jgi:hypothetical protein
MKRLNFLLLAFICILITSCQKDSTTVLSDKNLDSIVSEMRKFKISSKENAVFATINFNKETNTILDFKIEEKPLDVILIPSNINQLQSRADKYKVTCSKKIYGSGSQKTDTQECSSPYSCGTTIKKCLDAGGCAEICSASVIYVDEDNGVEPEIYVSLDN